MAYNRNENFFRITEFRRQAPPPILIETSGVSRRRSYFRFVARLVTLDVLLLRVSKDREMKSDLAQYQDRRGSRRLRRGCAELAAKLSISWGYPPPYPSEIE
jgi:hypothetical protein